MYTTTHQYNPTTAASGYHSIRLRIIPCIAVYLGYHLYCILAHQDIRLPNILGYNILSSVLLAHQEGIRLIALLGYQSIRLTT